MQIFPVFFPVAGNFPQRRVRSRLAPPPVSQQQNPFSAETEKGALFPALLAQITTGSPPTLDCYSQNVRVLDVFSPLGISRFGLRIVRFRPKQTFRQSGKRGVSRIIRMKYQGQEEYVALMYSNMSLNKTTFRSSTSSHV